TARDTRGGGLLEELAQDARYALRSLRRHPVFALTTMLTFGIGVGANMAVFSLLDATLLRPLPFASAERLMSVSLRMPTDAGPMDMTWSYPKYEMLARQQAVFDQMGLYQIEHVTVRWPEGVERFDVETVSSGYLRTLGVAPLLGALFGP